MHLFTERVDHLLVGLESYAPEHVISQCKLTGVGLARSSKPRHMGRRLLRLEAESVRLAHTIEL